MQRLAAEFLSDIRLAFRLLTRTPGVSVAAIAILAVVIGGNTAVFSVANALLLRPLPVAQPDDLARIRAGGSQMSWPNYQDIRERTTAFTDLAAHRRFVAGLTGRSAPVRLWGEQTSATYFSVLGVPPGMGRTYAPGDARRDVAVLADHTWRAHFGADPSIVGQHVAINGQSYEVVGVMPRGFRGTAPAGLLHDLWLPVDDSATTNALVTDRRATAFEVFGRLKSGVSYEQAAAAVRITMQGLRLEHGDLAQSLEAVEVFAVDGIGAFRGMSGIVLPLAAFLGLMTVVGGLVLLVGCANIAGLLIGRAAARRGEIAIRLALGAQPGRLMRQLFTESLVLAFFGGAAGVVVAVLLTAGVNPFLSRLPIPVVFDLHLDTHVLTYVLGLSTLTALTFGLAPARRASRIDLVSSLRDDATSMGRQQFRRILVTAQIAACTALLIWAGLFLRSLGRIADVAPGFDPHGVVLTTIEFQDLATGVVRQPDLAQLQQRLASAPGTEAVGLAQVVPLSLENVKFDVRDVQANVVRRVFANTLTPGWFATVRIPVRSGRDFEWSDRKGSPDVAIVNETLARDLWGGDALGKQLQVPGPRTVSVVGVVKDSAYMTLGETRAPTLYLPLQQRHVEGMTLHVRTTNVAVTTEVITREVVSLLPGTAVEVKPMTDTLAIAFLPAQVGAALTAAFGVIAVLLAATGVYGLVAFSVSQRTRELGIRQAIGASPSSIVRLVLRENMRRTAIGLAAGLAIGALGATVLRALLADVSPVDARTFGVVAVLIVGVALIASGVPALRAARVTPIDALRNT